MHHTIDSLKNNYDLRKGGDAWRKEMNIPPEVDMIMDLARKFFFNSKNPEQKIAFVPVLQRANAKQLQTAKFRYNPFAPPSKPKP
jgi:hypothetical protein